MTLHYVVPGDDFSLAGTASSEMKRTMNRLGIAPAVVKRAAIAMYEAEINMVIHAGGGMARVEITPELVVIELEDRGPGIPDLDLAMREGYSTAPSWIREMGFGAGMGLPNMKRNSDDMRVETEVGAGTKITLSYRLGAS